MKEEVISSAVSALVEQIYKDSKDVIKEVLAEGIQLFGYTIDDYLRNQIKKYSHIKTLLKGNVPVYIYDIYFQLNIRNDHHKVNTKHVKNIFTKSNMVTIIGDAGSGKSTLVKHLFINSIYNKYGIPILVELRYLNNTDDALTEYIYDKILDNKISQTNKILQKLLANGKFVFILDGFDELNSERKNSIQQDICSFTNKYRKNKYILTTRPYSDVENLPSFHNYNICPLSKDNGDIDKFIDIQLNDEKELADKIKTSINENQSRYIESYLKNPLLLSLYILTFQSNASVPNKKYIFYRRVINALFSEHDSKSKLGFIRQKRTGLSQEQFEEILKVFCYLSYFDNIYAFDYEYVDAKVREIKSRLKKYTFNTIDLIYDFKSALAIWVEDNGEYSFAHRSLQEYYAALFIKNINENNKERLYNKIADRITENSSVNEIENFLSLCQEMDTLWFNKYFLLPLLHELRNIIVCVNEREVFISTVIFLIDEIVIPKNLDKNSHLISTNINHDVYRTVYIHYKYTARINSQIRRHLRESFNLLEQYAGSVISIHDAIKNDIILEIFMTQNTINMAVALSNHIDESIVETSNYISDTINNDQEFIDMI